MWKNNSQGCAPYKKILMTPYDYAGYEIASMISHGWNENVSHAAETIKQHGLISGVIQAQPHQNNNVT
jgi:hypothetical protein